MMNKGNNNFGEVAVLNYIGTWNNRKMCAGSGSYLTSPVAAMVDELNPIGVLSDVTVTGRSGMRMAEGIKPDSRIRLFYNDFVISMVVVAASDEYRVKIREVRNLRTGYSCNNLGYADIQDMMEKGEV